MARSIFDLRGLPVATPGGFAAGVNVSALVGVVPNANLPSYSAYTPTLTASVANPTLGSGSSATSWYIQIGDLVHYYGAIAFGTAGVAAGTGTYRVSLPVNSAARIGSDRLGVSLNYDSSTGNVAQAVCQLSGGVATYFVQTYAAAWPAGAETPVGAAAPWTWAASDQIQWNITYEAA